MTLINTKYFDKAIEKINSFEKLEDKACDQLQQYMNELDAYIKKQLLELLASISRYSELLVNPTDLASVITWINKVIEKIAGPIAKMEAEYAELSLKYAELMTAINNVQSELQCNLTIPSLE